MVQPQPPRRPKRFAEPEIASPVAVWRSMLAASMNSIEQRRAHRSFDPRLEPRLSPSGAGFFHPVIAQSDLAQSDLAQSVLEATYRVRCDASAVEARARAIAIEQSVEMPVAAITDAFVRAQILGRVSGIAELSQGLFEIRIALAGATVGHDPGQLINMLFGN